MTNGEHTLGNVCRIRAHGTSPASAIVLTNRELAKGECPRRPLTADRRRIAEHLLAPEPVRTALIAHKVISEWLEADQRRIKPAARLEAKKVLEDEIRAAGYLPGPAGKPGTWLVSSMPSAEAPDVARTISQALKAFSALLGDRTIYVFGREN